MSLFKLVSDYKPCGDQPKAILSLTKGLEKKKPYQTLLGVTGSGKTFTVANVIQNIGLPTLVISHNKTLAAQLYFEFKEFFPENAVEYFVSYYDYYQPEAYIPHTDTYIEKDASINDRIDRLRLSATSSLMSRNDVIVIASVSCIYNLGSPEDYSNLIVFFKEGERISLDELMLKLVTIQYERNDIDFSRGHFRVRGDVLEVFPAYLETAYRIQLFGDVIESIKEINPLTGKMIHRVEQIGVYPAKHFVTTEDKVEKALRSIQLEMNQRVKELQKQNKLVEAQRLESRTNFDMEMMREAGYCNGVENYSRHLSQRPLGSRPASLIDYFPDNFLTIIDESHVTVPQINGMYNGDKARKTTLVEHGFRLPSCLDNRPLRFKEFESLVKKIIYLSATPAEYELEKSGNIVVEQIIRPTGLIDPEIILRPTESQIDDLIKEVQKRVKKAERVLVTTLTKRLAEDLSSYLAEMGIKGRYLHSEIDTLERVKILHDLRVGDFDCLVGINLLREGLDLPEVSLVAILDADKEGFLRSHTALIQVAGRAARNINGKVIMYADKVTRSMKKTIDETARRRKLQLAYNKKNNITPKSVKKAIKHGLEVFHEAKEFVAEVTGQNHEDFEFNMTISDLEKQMELAARNLQFEKAAMIRDKLVDIQEGKTPFVKSKKRRRKK